MNFPLCKQNYLGNNWRLYAKKESRWDTQKSRENVRKLLFYRTTTTTASSEAVTKNLPFQTHLQCSNRQSRLSQFIQQISTATHFPNLCRTRRWPVKWYLFPQKKNPYEFMCCSESPCTFHKYGPSHHNDMTTATFFVILHSQFINDDK